MAVVERRDRYSRPTGKHRHGGPETGTATVPIPAPWLCLLPWGSCICPCLPGLDRPPSTPPPYRFFLVGQSAVTLTASLLFRYVCAPGQTPPRPGICVSRSQLGASLPSCSPSAAAGDKRSRVDYQDIFRHHSRLEQTEAVVQLLTWPFRPRRSCGRLPCGRLPCPALPCHSWSTECNQAGKRSGRPSRVVYLGIHTSTHPPVDCSSSCPLASVHSPTSHIHSMAHGHGPGPACCVLSATPRGERQTTDGLGRAWLGLAWSDSHDSHDNRDNLDNQ